MTDSLSIPFQLQVGRHCERILQGNRGRLLIDGADYFGDLASRLRSGADSCGSSDGICIPV